ASSPSEAIAVFDPHIVVMPGDPWFVDLRALVPEIASFAKRFKGRLSSADRNVALAVAQRPGSGATTMLRMLLGELRAAGLVPISVRAPAQGRFGFVDVLLRIASGVLVQCEAEGLMVADPVVKRLRGWLAEHGLDGELRDYVRLGR